MYKYIGLAVFFIIILSNSWNCEVKKNENKITPYRIISLAPHITEIIYAIGAQDKLIAVTNFCNYPEEAKSKQRIGGLLNPNIELIISLKPTHLFGVPAHEKLDQKLKKFGLNVTMMPNENITDVLNSIKRIGQEIGYNPQSANLINQISHKLDSLKIKSGEKSGNSAVLIIGRERGMLRNITVAGKDTFLDEIWQLCGGKNIFDDMPIRYGTISLESLLIKDPDIIIEFEMEGGRNVLRVKNATEWDALNNLTAVKNHNIFIINGNHTLIPGPRMGLLVEDFTRILQDFNSMNTVE